MQTQHRKPPPFENTPLLGTDHGYDNTVSYGHRDVESRSSGHQDRSRRDIAPAVAKPPIIDHSDYACLIKIPRAWLSTISVLSALHNCLWAGSVLIFSLYAPLFNQKLGYRQMQINAVSTASELGMYLPVPVFGFICDQYGPAKLSLMSTSFFGPGYALAAAAYANNWDYKIMVVAFGLIGMGSSSMYFSGITACAKAIQGRRGLALAMPIACFGLSSLWEAQLVTYLFTGPDSILQVEKVFAFFSIAMPLVGMLGFFGLTSLDINRDDTVSTESEDLDDKGFFNSETMAFLKDRTMWAFATGVFLVTGPGEAFINNMGNLIQTLDQEVNIATQISYLSLTSTASRLIAGAVSDYFAPPLADETLPLAEAPRKRPTFSRMTILSIFAGIMFLGTFLIASGAVHNNPDLFSIVSSSIGIGYGAAFCLSPTVVSVVWGTKNFGTNWGFVIMTPALGAVVYGSLFASYYDKLAGDDGTCKGFVCIRNSFGYMAGSVVVAVVIWMLTWRKWSMKGVSV